MGAGIVAQGKIPSEADNGRTVAVFLNYRTPNHTVRAVRSLAASHTRVADMIVVDNGSGDGSPEQLAASLPGIRLIEMPINGGFSAGCNAGIREALALKAAKVLLLNSDVVVTPDAIARLGTAIDDDPGLGIAGPIVVSHTRPATIESLGIRYSRGTGRMRHAGYGERLSGSTPFERRDVDAVSGCAMLIRREVFERIGLFAEEYFFGFEDLDFCLRARAAGFRSACIGGATVQHDAHLSIGEASGRRIYFGTRNHLLLAQRFGTSQSPPGRWLQTASVLGLNLAHVLLTSRVPRMAGLRAFAEGAWDHFRGRYGSSEGG
jgi:GT2 family glycosyltransferase